MPVVLHCCLGAGHCYSCISSNCRRGAGPPVHVAGPPRAASDRATTTIEFASSPWCFPTTPSPPESTPLAGNRGPHASFVPKSRRDLARQFDKRQGVFCEVIDSGILDALHEGHDVEAKPEEGVWRYIQKTGGLSKCQDGRYSPSECHLTNTDLVLDSRWSILFAEELSAGGLGYSVYTSHLCLLEDVI